MAGWARPMLTEFATWWARQMLDLAPARLRARDPAQDNALIVSPEGSPAAPHALRAALRRQGTEAPLGSFGADAAGAERLRRSVSARPRAVVVRLPPDALLEREVTMPLAAERAPQQALHYEMDRLTPFASDAIFWSWAAAKRDKARGKLHLRLFFAPKMSLEGTLGMLQRAGLPATLLEAATAGGVRSIPLASPDPAGTLRRRRLEVAMQAACVTLAVIAVALPFARQSLALRAAERKIAALRPATEQVEALRRRLSGAGSGADVVVAERAHLGDVLQVLAAVTDLLPDDTFLTELSMHQGKLGIGGQSAAAAKLIPVLAAEPTLRNPSFTAPVTRIDNGAFDQFSIRAELAP